MKNQIQHIARKIVLGLAVVVIAGLGAYRLVQIGTVDAATTPCIITVFGVQYDITPLQNAHTGGNVFTCGADMTAVYQSQHGTNVGRISPYLITPTLSPTPTPTPTPIPGTGATPTVTPTPAPTGVITPTPTKKEDRHDDEEEFEEEHEEEEEHDEDEKEIRSDHSTKKSQYKEDE